MFKRQKKENVEDEALGKRANEDGWHANVFFLNIQ